MNYCKITTDKQAQMMPNPVEMKISNPTESKKKLIAQLDNWLEMVYTDEPEYDPETHYAESYWEEENGKAVQHWVVKPIEPEQE